MRRTLAAKGKNLGTRVHTRTHTQTYIVLVKDSEGRIEDGERDRDKDR